MRRRTASLLAGAALTFVAASAPTADPWGTLADGRDVRHFVLTNDRGARLELTDVGAAIVALDLPTPGGGMRDVIVGPKEFTGFTAKPRRFGAIVGRYAGRLPGRITIAGKTYPLALNPSGVTLHGGDPGFDRAVWRGKPFETTDASGVAFTLVSPAGQQGFPGKLTVVARYSLQKHADVVALDITASTDRPTAVNLTNHVYFNLGDSDTIACHNLRVDAARFQQVDERKLPTGRLLPVAGTIDDYRAGRSLGAVIAAGGTDTAVLLDRPEATLRDRQSGLTMTLRTDQPAIQVYTGNGFDGTHVGRPGKPIAQYGGVALEPMRLPGSAQTMVAPGTPYRWSARWSFAPGPPSRCEPTARR